MRCTALPPCEPLYRLAHLQLVLFPLPFTHSRNLHRFPFRSEAFDMPISTLAHSSRNTALPSSLQNVVAVINARSRQLKLSLKMWKPLLRMRLATLRGPKMAIVRPWVCLALLDLERMKQRPVADLIISEASWKVRPNLLLLTILF
jgi:hypothetical protein